MRWKAWEAAFRVYSLGAPLNFLDFPPPRENQKITTSDSNGREISRLPVILAMAAVFCPVGCEFSLIVLVFGTGGSSNRRGHSTAEQRAQKAERQQPYPALRIAAEQAKKTRPKHIRA